MMEGNVAAVFQERQKGTLPGELDIQWEDFLGTAKEGETVACTARLAHAGRMTQVWDAEAVNQTTGKTMALFRCTQMVLYPR